MTYTLFVIIVCSVWGFIQGWYFPEKAKDSKPIIDIKVNLK